MQDSALLRGCFTKDRYNITDYLQAYSMTKVAISQSNYIPWKGYFDLINSVDYFVLFDDMQYTRRDWRNRNRIKTHHGLLWLTIPVKAKGNYYAKIKEIEVADDSWFKEHWLTITHNYNRAQYFKEYKTFFSNLYYAQQSEIYLSKINYNFIASICDFLKIKTKLLWSAQFELVDGKTERLVHICKQLGATEYLSGPSARAYLDESLFIRNNIELKYMDYSGYPEYKQLFPPFVHEVSILDLIFNEGKNAVNYMKSF